MRRCSTLFGLIFVVVIFATNKVITEARQHQTKPKLLKQSLVDAVNSNPNAGWVAAMHPHLSHYTEEDASSLLGLVPPKKEAGQRMLSIQADGTEGTTDFTLPKNYSVLTAYPQCSNIFGKIRDQGHCGACWAMAITGSLQDRLCIKFNKTVILSPNDLLACCDSCSASCRFGGDILETWAYIVYNGIHSEECYPYFDQAGCPYGGCNMMDGKPKCAPMCTASSHQSWNNSKYWVGDFYVSGTTGITDEYIMKEIYQHGSMTIAMDVYEDFVAYQSGVYQHVAGNVIGAHVVRLLGWGTTAQGVEYWIAANSWNVYWGDNGFFKIRRGWNIGNGLDDSWISAAYPSLTQVPQKNI